MIRFGVLLYLKCSLCCDSNRHDVGLHIFVSVCGTVGALHRTRAGWWRGVDGIRRGIFLAVFRYVGWGRRIFYWYVSIFNRRVFVFFFQVGLAVGVHR